MHIRAVLPAAVAIGLAMGPAAQASSANSDQIRAKAAGDMPRFRSNPKA